MIILLVAAWVVWAFVVRRLLDNPRADALTGILLGIVRVYALSVHSLRAEGLRNVPRTRSPGALVVVCNHTAGVDPLLVQVLLPFEVRWMMGRDMRIPQLADFWEFAGVIDVNRTGRDVTSAKVALRHLDQGGVVGVFPEGRIARPRGVILPFHAGVGLLVARSGARVLPALIRGTPEARSAWGSLLRLSRSRVHFGPLMSFDGRTPAEITDELREWFRHESGWALSDGKHLASLRTGEA